MYTEEEVEKLINARKEQMKRTLEDVLHHIQEVQDAIDANNQMLVGEKFSQLSEYMTQFRDWK